EIGVGHLGVILVAHRPLERRAVLALALGDRGLDLGVGPVADASGLVRSDVARLGHAPWTGEFAAALTERVFEVRAAAGAERRVALQAMADGNEVEAELELVVEVGLRVGLLGAG